MFFKKQKFYTEEELEKYKENYWNRIREQEKQVQCQHKYKSIKYTNNMDCWGFIERSEKFQCVHCKQTKYIDLKSEAEQANNDALSPNSNLGI